MKAPSTPPPPETPPPTRMPVSAPYYDPNREREKLLAYQEAQNREGVQSTMLTEALTGRAGGGGTGSPSRAVV